MFCGQLVKHLPWEASYIYIQYIQSSDTCICACVCVLRDGFEARVWEIGVVVSLEAMRKKLDTRFPAVITVSVSLFLLSLYVFLELFCAYE